MDRTGKQVGARVRVEFCIRAPFFLWRFRGASDRKSQSPSPARDSRFGPIPRRGAEIKTVRSHRTESLVPLDPRSRSQVAGPGPSPRRTAGAREDPTNRALDSRCRPLRDPLVSLLRRPAGPWVGAAGEASAQYSRDSPRGQGQLQSKRTSPGVTGGPSVRPRGEWHRDGSL